MAENGDKAGKRNIKMSHIAKAANIAFAIAAGDTLLMVVLFYPLKMNVTASVMGIFALVLFLALATGATLKTWAREVVAEPPYQMFRYPGTWFLAAAYIVLLCDIVGIVFVGMILPHTSFLPAAFSIDLLLRIASIGVAIAFLGFVALLIQMIWNAWRRFSRTIHRR
jgi:hypothetical protein